MFSQRTIYERYVCTNYTSCHLLSCDSSSNDYDLFEMGLDVWPHWLLGGNCGSYNVSVQSRAAAATPRTLIHLSSHSPLSLVNARSGKVCYCHTLSCINIHQVIPTKWRNTFLLLGFYTLVCILKWASNISNVLNQSLILVLYFTWVSLMTNILWAP